MARVRRLASEIKSDQSKKKKRICECTDDFYANVKFLEQTFSTFRAEQTSVTYEEMQKCFRALVRSEMTLDIRERLDEVVELFNFFNIDKGRTFMAKMVSFLEIINEKQSKSSDADASAQSRR
tara:strand:- start:361 stop:729 length:369 start_codon:yes stop_codon:yes gene_type:complete